MSILCIPIFNLLQLLFFALRIQAHQKTSPLCGRRFFFTHLGSNHSTNLHCCLCWSFLIVIDVTFILTPDARNQHSNNNHTLQRKAHPTRGPATVRHYNEALITNNGRCAMFAMPLIVALLMPWLCLLLPPLLPSLLCSWWLFPCCCDWPLVALS